LLGTHSFDFAPYLVRYVRIVEAFKDIYNKSKGYLFVSFLSEFIAVLNLLKLRIVIPAITAGHLLLTSVSSPP
jgi:hypothetical protein